MPQDLKDIADDVEITLRHRLLGYQIGRLRSDNTLLRTEAAAAAVLIFEEHEEGELVGLYVATKLLGSFDASRMLHARVVYALASEGLDMIEETLMVQIMGRTFGL